jgi:hypothetical protein
LTVTSWPADWLAHQEHAEAQRWRVIMDPMVGESIVATASHLVLRGRVRLTPVAHPCRRIARLYRAIQFSECFTDLAIVSTLSTQLSWSHFVELNTGRCLLAEHPEREGVPTYGASTVGRGVVHRNCEQPSADPCRSPRVQSPFSQWAAMRTRRVQSQVLQRLNRPHHWADPGNP